MVKILPPDPPYVGPPRWHGGTGNKPVDLLVVHGTAGAEPGVPGAARATASYSKATSRPSSWHYCRDAVEAVQLTYDSVIAYHCGHNTHSIGYELCCSLSNQGGILVKATTTARALTHWQTKSHRVMLREAARDFARLCLAYGVPPVRVTAAQLRRGGARGICGHNDIRLAFPGSTSHWDPGPFFPWRRFMRMVSAEVLALQDNTPTPRPQPTPAGPALTVGWWNMRRDRKDKGAAARAALAVMDADDLDVLLLQETADYIHQLRALPGVNLVAFDDKPGQKDTAILVRDGHTLSDTGIARMTRDGWITVRGGHTPPKWMPHVLVDGWLRVGSIHTAPSVEFDGDDTPEGPVRRVASTVQHARSVVAFAKNHPGPLVIGGDWNATPDDRGRYSPWWISRQTGLAVVAADDPTHGHPEHGEVIDFGLARGVTGEARTSSRHGSDHAAGAATLTKETP